jgi:hypothetical protein
MRVSLLCSEDVDKPMLTSLVQQEPWEKDCAILVESDIEWDLKGERKFAKWD